MPPPPQPPPPPPAPSSSGAGGISTATKPAKKWATVAVAEPEPEGPSVAVGDDMIAGIDANVHGLVAPEDLPKPKITRVCDEQARLGYISEAAHEYLDTVDGLRTKAALLADLVRKSKRMAVFAGAGLSTAAGIADYASHALGEESLSATQKTVEWMDLQPTFAHCALAALHSAGHVKSVLSQNHDGLFQKAGIPQACVNEIHGGWYDPSNPTVAMSGECRADLSRWLLKMEQEADLVLVLGSSMAGMTAELLVTSCAKRASRGWDGALGSVICGFQRTRHDSVAALRFYCSCDALLEVLLHELDISVTPCPCMIPSTDPAEDIFELPHYDASTGKRIAEGNSATIGCTLDLRPGAVIGVTGSSYHAADQGVVVGRDAHGHWDLVMLHKKVYGIVGIASATGNEWQQDVAMPTATTNAWADSQLAREPGLKRQRAKLGRWWIAQAMAGKIDMLPVITIADAA